MKLIHLGYIELAQEGSCAALNLKYSNMLFSGKDDWYMHIHTDLLNVRLTPIIIHI